MVKIQDLSIILREYDIKPIDITKNSDGTPNTKRNPWRQMPVNPYITEDGKGNLDVESDQEGVDG